MTARFRDRAITFANGATGRTIDVPSASPRNYHQAVSAATEMPSTVIDGKLFLPPGSRDPAGLPLVIVVPGIVVTGPSPFGSSSSAPVVPSPVALSSTNGTLVFLDSAQPRPAARYYRLATP